MALDGPYANAARQDTYEKYTIMGKTFDPEKPEDYVESFAIKTRPRERESGSMSVNIRYRHVLLFFRSCWSFAFVLVWQLAPVGERSRASNATDMDPEYAETLMGATAKGEIGNAGPLGGRWSQIWEPYCRTHFMTPGPNDKGVSESSLDTRSPVSRSGLAWQRFWSRFRSDS